MKITIEIGSELLKEAGEERLKKRVGEALLKYEAELASEKSRNGYQPDEYSEEDRRLLERIVIAPETSFGKPHVRGTRIAVIHVLDILASGVPEEEIFEDYPRLKKDDLKACLLYARKELEERHRNASFEFALKDGRYEVCR